MKRADIKLGYSCNNECIHCVISDFRDIILKEGKPEDIPSETFRQEMLDSRSRTGSIVFTGGEPTIRKDILDLVSFAKDLGFNIMMQTNGRRLAKMDFAQALCAIAPLRFVIALHGPNAEVHDKITKKHNSFYETVQGIRNVIEIRKTAESLSGKIVISRVNAPYILDTVRLMVELGFKYVNLTFPHACGNARKYFHEVVPHYEEIKYQVIEAIEYCLNNRISVDTEAIPFCFLPDVEHVAVELPMMKEQYTELKQYGSKDKILDWQKVRRQIKSKFPQCIKCRFDAVCEGPWQEYPEYYGEDEFIPVPGTPVTDPDEIIMQKHREDLLLSPIFNFMPDR